MPPPRVRALLALAVTIGMGAERLPWTLAKPVCRVGGAAWWAASAAARDAVRANLRHVLQAEPSPDLIRDVFFYGALNYWDTLRLAQATPEAVQSRISATGWEHAEAAFARGQGLIAVGAHLGSPAVVGNIFPLRGHKTVAIVEATPSRELYRFFNARRGKLGIRMIPANRDAFGICLQALRQNQVVGLVTDRDVTGGGVPVRFFNAPTTFPGGAAALSLRSGAPILVTGATWRSDGGFAGFIEPPLPGTGRVVRHAGRDQLIALTQSVAERLEYHIRQTPGQWTVFQRRWAE